MTKRRRVFVFVGIAAVDVVLGLALAKVVWDACYYDGYDSAAPLNAASKGEVIERPDYVRTELTLDGLPGQSVPIVLAMPRNTAGPAPCVIFLHGIGQDKDFIDEIVGPFVQAGFGMVSFDQYTRGERRLQGAGPLDRLLALRRRGAMTVVETRRLVDYLVTRPDIASDRIYLVGASYGAVTGATAVAFEPRIRAAVLVYGGGNLPKLLGNDEIRKTLGAWTGAAARLLAFLLAAGEPTRHVKGISPRPVLFQNGTRDSLIPTASAQALFDAAREPKEIIWYDSDHIGLNRDTMWHVLNDAIRWLKKQDATVAGT
jgi:dienelactone hydrolase